MLRRFLSYIAGFVIITISGQGIERFLNLAIQRNITIWDVQWIDQHTVRAKVQLWGVRGLRHVARLSRCRFRIKSRHGVPFILIWTTKRKMLVAGGIFFATSLYVLSSFIFFIDVTSPEPFKVVNPDMIKRLAKEQGIRTGRPKWLMNFEKTEKYILKTVPHLTWVDITTKGTKLEINVVEKVLPDPGDKSTLAGHVVALKDGVITEILVMKGYPRVRPGNTVAKGQILISGIPEVLIDENTDVNQIPLPVKADGIVRARVWYQGYGECPVLEKGFKNTGKVAQTIKVKWKGGEVVVWGAKKSPFAYNISDNKTRPLILWRNINLPVEIITTRYREQIPYEKEWGEEGAWTEAVELALKAIKRQLSVDAKIINQEILKVAENVPGLMRVSVRVEVEENIGKCIPAQEQIY